MDIDQLNAQFSISGQVSFIKSEGDLVQAHINNSHASAVVSIYAGQVLSFRPVGHDHDLMFVSEAACFQQGKAIKGGIPVCWPWFGPDPQDRGRSAHGFVRNRQWQVISTKQLDNGDTLLVLGINSDEQTLAVWPHLFELRIEITVGQSLAIKLISTNRDLETITITQALHSYFNVGEVTEMQVKGLENKHYFDKLDGMNVKTQQGAVTVREAVDRIYTDTNKPVSIIDPVLHRKIHIKSIGSITTVVWNPWIKQSAEMADFKDDEYKQMLCVETANAGPEQIFLAAGASYELGAIYSIETD